MEQPTCVYFLTLIRIDNGEITDLTTTAFYFNKAEIIYCLRHNQNDVLQGDRFNYAVIEAFKPGVSYLISDVEWYEINYTGKYLIRLIEPPKGFEQSKAFAISR